MECKDFWLGWRSEETERYAPLTLHTHTTYVEPVLLIFVVRTQVSTIGVQDVLTGSTARSSRPPVAIVGRGQRTIVDAADNRSERGYISRIVGSDAINLSLSWQGPAFGANVLGGGRASGVGI